MSATRRRNSKAKTGQADRHKQEVSRVLTDHGREKESLIVRRGPALIGCMPFLESNLVQHLRTVRAANSSRMMPTWICRAVEEIVGERGAREDVSRRTLRDASMNNDMPIASFGIQDLTSPFSSVRDLACPLSPVRSCVPPFHRYDLSTLR